MLVELSAGLLEEGENPEDAMHSELQEEVAMTANRLKLIDGYRLTAGGSAAGGQSTASITAIGSLCLAVRRETLRQRWLTL